MSIIIPINKTLVDWNDGKWNGCFRANKYARRYINVDKDKHHVRTEKSRDIRQS